MTKKYWPALAFLLAASSLAGVAFAQSLAPRLSVDAGGTLRTADGGKAYYFGVNYTAPFAYSYRALRRRGIDPRRAIYMDVEQMARLKLNAYRIHVWDREISDARGNLIENDHLALLDYLLARLAERKIAVTLTPIAWWGTGWPEPDPPTPGFSALYTKQQMNTDPKAIAASENYIRQLMAHVNRETGRRYVDDPNIVAVELFNEPKHDSAGAAATDYINRLARPVRELGYKGPIFYNISEQGNRPDFAAAVCAAGIQGVSYQWYPTGLVRGSTLHANMLPNGAQYELPFRGVRGCDSKAKMVYEFDAADVAGSYMYPAMANAFRKAGFQWATQFSYDPSHIADFNTEYPTHYLNLLYTPAKAVSFLIAGEVFRHGAGDLRVSYEDDTSQLTTATGFFHSASTSARPRQPARLREIAGVGSSPLVEYGGTGAYFLDKLGEGTWLLELYPDVIRHHDPFAKVSEARQVRQLIRAERPMRVRLPDLGQSFEVTPVSQAATARQRAAGGAFRAVPGKYLLARRSGATLPAGVRRELPVPAIAALPGMGVEHEPCRIAPSGAPLRVAARVVASAPVLAATLHARRVGGRTFTAFPMQAVANGAYEAMIPADSALLQPGGIEYAVSVDTAGGTRTYPGAAEGQPSDWDFVGDSVWTTQILPSLDRVPLFVPTQDRAKLLLPRWQQSRPYSVDLVPGPGGSSLRIKAAAPFVMRASSDAIREACVGQLNSPASLRFSARSGSGKDQRMTISLVTADGAAWGSDIVVGSGWREYRVPLVDLKRVRLALLPAAYPVFQPDFQRRIEPGGRFSAAAVEGMQLELHTGPTESVLEIGEVALTR